MPRLFLASDDLLLVDCVASAIVSVETSILGEEIGLTWYPSQLLLYPLFCMIGNCTLALPRSFEHHIYHTSLM